MQTRHPIVVITGILILTALLPVSLSIWMAHKNASQAFTAELENVSRQVMLRSQMVATQAEEALEQLKSSKLAPCSREHLLEMRQVSYSHRYIQEVLYFHDLEPLCSSFEEMKVGKQFPPSQALTSKGYQVWLTTKNDIGIDRSMAGLGSANYVVIVDPESLIDVLPYGQWPINIALIGLKNNAIVASTSPHAQEVWAQALSTNKTQFRHNDVIYNINRYPKLNIATVTWASTLPLDEGWHHQLLYWLPFGATISMLSAWLIRRVLRHLRSPHQLLQNAIRSREIIVHYQPIVSLTDERIVGAEALARWPQPDGTFLAPDIFIPLAEQNGLMTSLTELIVARVFSDLGPWLQQHPQYYVSINISANDLHSTTLPVLIAQRVARWRIAPEQIALELTERSFTDLNVSAPAIARYRESGHPVYIDDFGTGFSSLSYLHGIEADTLKIDKFFVETVEHNQVTPHIIRLAQTLNLKTVAEGIETPQQAAWLRERGVEYGQGWLYSKALEKNAFMAWAEQNLHRPES
ncbi:hypothetical protein AC791_07440 [Klebsiella sp. RIT-PI-d]|uniref:EAL domain-containing protein n=1 Tax=Klebsiella sp. RIT-PI-d TaxID=1681196 RepID=UPI000676AE53|nr:EAL domain-containing protein [Klebsiella sp. RIT-PI-d]KNC08547.1 hypothetical protein AC791_07440 [Klebsiella sp. RIT-PI-d]